MCARSIGLISSDASLPLAKLGKTFIVQLNFRLRCLPVGPVIRVAVVVAAVAMEDVTADVTTEGEVSEADVTAAGIEDSEEVATGTVADAEGNFIN